MAAQSNRGIWHSFPNTHPMFSGVRKVQISRGFWPITHPRGVNVWYGYFYYSAKTGAWYDANGEVVSHRVSAWGSLGD